MQLPIDRIEAGVEKLAKAKAETLDAGTQAAEAIMTTDTRSKQAAVEIEIGGVKLTRGGHFNGSRIEPAKKCSDGWVVTK